MHASYEFLLNPSIPFFMDERTATRDAVCKLLVELYIYHKFDLFIPRHWRPVKI